MLAALFARERTGSGQRVEVALHDGLLPSSPTTRRTGGPGDPADAAGERPSIDRPYQTFQAADAWINVGVGNERQWRALCAVVEKPEWLEDPRFADNAARVEHREELVPLLEEMFVARPAAEWLERSAPPGSRAGAYARWPRR